MRKTGQDARWGVVAVVGFLLLVFIGCTATLHDEPRSASTGANGLASATSGGATGQDLAAAAARPAPAVVRPESALAQPRVADAVATAPVRAAATLSATGVEPFADDGTLRVLQIRLAEYDGRTAIIAALSQPPYAVEHFTLPSPPRLVIDVTGPVDPLARPMINRTTDPDVSAVRFGVYGGKLRIVADLTERARDYVIERGETSVVALLGPSQSARVDTVLYASPEMTLAAPQEAPTQVATQEADVAPEAETEPAGAFEDDADPSTDQPGDVEPGVTPDESTPEVDQYRPQLASMDDEELRTYEATTKTSTALDPISEETIATHPTKADIEEAARLADIEPATSDPAVEDDVLARLDEPSSNRQGRRPDPAPEPADDLLADTAIDPAYVLPAAAKKTTSKTEVSVSGEPYRPLSLRDPSEYTGQRISLDFKDADIQNVLRILADVSGLNIITTEDVSGKLTMRLIDVPWDQALDAILRAKGLDMVREGNIVRVSTVEQLKKERDAQRAADEAQKQVEPLGVRYIKVNYAKADEKLVKKVQEVLTERGSATWDERTNTIVVRDIARGLDDAYQLIVNFDTQTPQVLIESNIVEAQENFLRDLGIQWGHTYLASPETGNATGVNFPGRVRGGGVLAGAPNSPAGQVPFIADFPAQGLAPGAGTAYDLLLGSLDGTNSLSARLTALETMRRGKIISRPRVVTLNNVPAKIESVVIVRIKTPSSGTVLNNATGAAGVAGSSGQAAFEEFRTGIILNVTPQVSSDGYIFLDVHAKSSTLEGSQTDPNIIPNEISREANSHVLIKDGETFVLGGIFRNVLNNDDRGVPFFHSIPVIGWAFKNKRNQDDRQELLVFITPRTVRSRGTETVASLPSAQTLWQNRENP